MKLEVKDRIVLLNILPKEGNVVNLRVLQKLQLQLGFTEEEHAALQFQTKESGTAWKEGVEARDFMIAPKANALICGAFEVLNSNGKLTLEHLPTYDKFIKEE